MLSMNLSPCLASCWASSQTQAGDKCCGSSLPPLPNFFLAALPCAACIATRGTNKATPHKEQRIRFKVGKTTVVRLWLGKDKAWLGKNKSREHARMFVCAYILKQQGVRYKVG